MTRNRWMALSGAIVAGVGALDVWCDRTGTITLSQSIREVSRVHTPVGAAALVGTFAAINGVLVPHLLHVAVQAVGAAVEAAAEEFGGDWDVAA